MFIAGVTTLWCTISIKENTNVSGKMTNSDIILYLFDYSSDIGFWININVDGEIEKNFRSGLFMLISLVTTTGFVVDDYTKLESWF